jgi:hypothetical protein
MPATVGCCDWACCDWAKLEGLFDMPTTDIHSMRAHFAARNGYRRSVFTPLMREFIAVKDNPYPCHFSLSTEVVPGSVRAQSLIPATQPP